MTDFVELLTIALLFSPQRLDKTINFCFACFCFYKFIHSLSMPIDNQLLRARVGIYNFRRPFTKLKFVKSQNKCPTTSTLFTNSLPLLLYCLFVYLLPIFQKGFFVTVKSVDHVLLSVHMFCFICFLILFSGKYF